MAESTLAVIQLVDFTTRVARRVKDSLSSTREVPEYLREINIHLPLFIATLEQTGNDIEKGLYSEQVSEKLKKLVDECTADIYKIEEILAQVTPNEADSKGRRLRRAMLGVKFGRDVRGISSRLLQTIDSLILIQRAAVVKTLNEIRIGQRNSGVPLSFQHENSGG
ncbi:hypothetical protein BJX63DRAFT_409221 [Aspergillus granulosus]|uniref:NACHT-NTPase and P-loop NTPases N-terminal domain-containing protein n=1 Tax=Aspergillus granulosus TaxID=176169 RepID=A0ABR4GYZ6_9EURO